MIYKEQSSDIKRADKKRKSNCPIYQHSLSPTLSPLASAIKIALFGIGMVHGTANAATIEVNSNLDDGTDCTLRDAIVSLNIGVLQQGCINVGGPFGDDDIVNIADTLTGDTISLVNGVLEVSNIVNSDVVSRPSLILNGNGVTVDAGLQSSAFFVDNASLTIINATIAGGTSSGFGVFGIDTRYSSVSLTNSQVSNGVRGYSSNVDVINSDISSNSNGDGISASLSELNVINSNVSGNSGSGISAGNLSQVTIDSTTVSDNSDGGVDLFYYAYTDIINSTITANSSSRSGSAVSVIQSLSPDPYYSGFGPSFVNIIGSTISGNSSTGSGASIAAEERGAINITNSIIANTIGGSDCFNRVDSQINIDSSSIIEDGSCQTLARAIDPVLLPLADNGCVVMSGALGSQACVMTHALGVGSPAIDTALNSDLVVDQIGTARPQGAGSDVGAFEVASNTLPRITVPRTFAQEGDGFARVEVLLSELSDEEVRVRFRTVVPNGQNNPATSNVDYIDRSGTIVFPPGVIRRTRTMMVLDDNDVEPNEVFRFELSQPINAEIAGDGSGLQRVFILNDDDIASVDLPELTVARTSAREDDGFVRVEVLLSEPSTDEIRVDFRTVIPSGQNNPATSGVDYIDRSGTIVFPPGVVRRTRTMTINDDNIVEANEAFRFELSNARNAEIADDGSALQRVFIINDD